MVRKGSGGGHSFGGGVATLHAGRQGCGSTSWPPLLLLFVAWQWGRIARGEGWALATKSSVCGAHEATGR
eukprot:scaffold11699_cov109-Isochrysis_galbana.AAC.2